MVILLFKNYFPKVIEFISSTLGVLYIYFFLTEIFLTFITVTYLYVNF